MNEGEKFLQAAKNGILFPHSQDKESFHFLNESTLIKYERPDFILMGENRIIGVEHFEFDSSRSTRKGSLYRREDVRLDKELNDEIDYEMKKKKDELYFGRSGSLKITNSTEFYLNNLKKHFLSHFDKIDDYIARVKSITQHEDKEIRTAFFIEDTTPLGLRIYAPNNTGHQITRLFEIQEFREMLLLINAQEKLDYLFFIHSESRYLDCVEVNSLLSDTCSVSSYPLCEQRVINTEGPKVFNFKAIIPDNKDEGG